jgi:hypothetical protein
MGEMTKIHLVNQPESGAAGVKKTSEE